MKKANDAPKAGAKGFSLVVLPSKDCLHDAIAANGYCDPRKCWHFVAINKLMEEMEPGGQHRVKVDAGHIKVIYRGWRYVSDTPLHVKRSLMLFDKERYNEVYIREYKLRFRRTTKIIKQPYSKERQEQINAARAARVAAGRPDRAYSLRKRVEGFSGIV